MSSTIETSKPMAPVAATGPTADRASNEVRAWSSEVTQRCGCNVNLPVWQPAPMSIRDCSLGTKSIAHSQAETHCLHYGGIAPHLLLRFNCGMQTKGLARQKSHKLAKCGHDSVRVDYGTHPRCLTSDSKWHRSASHRFARFLPID